MKAEAFFQILNFILTYFIYFLMKKARTAKKIIWICFYHNMNTFALENSAIQTRILKCIFSSLNAPPIAVLQIFQNFENKRNGRRIDLN